MSDQPMAASGDSDYIMTPDDSQKKPSLFGKLKDKTKKAGTKIKSKVGKKNQPGDDMSPDGDEEEEDIDDVSTPPAAPYTSTFGTKDQYSPPDISGLGISDSSTPAPTSAATSYDEPSYKSYDEPSVPQKASEISQGVKEATYGGAAATAGALGYEGYEKEKPFTEKASDATGDLGGKAQEYGNRGYDAATGAKDTVADQTKDTFGMFGSEPSATDKAYGAKDDVQSTASDTADAAQSKAYDAKDAVGSKVDDLNNATDDSETYTQKASNTATSAKQSVAETLGLAGASEGPSILDKTKGALGYGTPTVGDQAQSKAADLNNATDDSETYTQKASNTAASAKQSVAETLGLAGASEGPSILDKTKGALGYGTPTVGDQAQSKAADLNNATNDSETYTDKATNAAYAAKNTAADTLGSTVDTTKDYTGSAANTAADYATQTKDNTVGAATQAKDTTVDAATPTQEHKALSQQITDTLGGYATKAQETVASVTPSTTPATTTDATAAHPDNKPASPGILEKIGGLFYGAKGPEHHDTPPTTQ